jgi:hypothetical protein
MTERWKCIICGRDKFSRAYQPHRCSSGVVTKNWKKMAKIRGITGPTFIRIDR